MLYDRHWKEKNGVFHSFMKKSAAAHRPAAEGSNSIWLLFPVPNIPGQTACGKTGSP
jgi:hypothetical protein